MPVGIPRRFNSDDAFCDCTPRKGKVAAGWLAWQETLVDHPIHTALNNGERRLGRHGLPVDGFCPQTRTAYEFNGCFWHGHCCDESSFRDVGDVPASDRNPKTALKLAYLQALGYTVVRVWECEWSRQIDACSTIKCFLKAFNDATYGCQRKNPTQQSLLQEVLDGSFFGYVECDIHVPSHLTQNFSEMSPIFINVALNRNHLSPRMLQHVQATGEFSMPRRCLVGAMAGTKILLSELLRWYLKHGLVVTKIYQVIQYNAQPTFSAFAQSITEARRQGDVDPLKQLLANTAKLVGNSFYGKTITDKTKHKNISYTDDETKISCQVVNRHFHSLEPLGEGLYAMCCYKGKVTFPHCFHQTMLPLHTHTHCLYLSFTSFSTDLYGRSHHRRLHHPSESQTQDARVSLQTSRPVSLSNASNKLSTSLASSYVVLIFYSFLRYIDRMDYQMINMDTNSSYKVLSGPMDRVIKPHKRSEFFLNYGLWFVVPYCNRHESDFLQTMIHGNGHWTSMGPFCNLARKHDSRMSGKFKEEFRGSVIYAKTYITAQQSEHQPAAVKCSSKGLSKKTNNLTISNFVAVLSNKTSITGFNMGFIKKDNVIYTYNQRHAGLSYFYSKRKVLDDGVSTTHLDI